MLCFCSLTSVYVYGYALNLLNSCMSALPLPRAAACSFAMDRDAQACTRLEVHEVYTLLPSNKAPMGVVEQPDGNYAFGATAAAHHPHPGMSHGQQGAPYGVPPAGSYAQPAVGYPSVPRA
jgi:hypothetical protein